MIIPTYLTKKKTKAEKAYDLLTQSLSLQEINELIILLDGHMEVESQEMMKEQM